MNSQTRSRDYAVIKFSPKYDDEGCPYYVGDAEAVNGYIGFRIVESVNDPRFNISSITGYPFDKPNGEMWTSGTCPESWEAGETGFGYHYCDVDDAGAAILGFFAGNYQALGVYGYGGTEFNGAPIIEEEAVYNTIYDLSERGKPLDETCLSEPTASPTSAPTILTLPPEENECPCTSEFVLFRWICILFNFFTCIFG